MFRFGPYSDVDKGDFRAGPGASQAFWSRTGAPAALSDPDLAIFAVAVMENDDGNAETLRGIVKGLVGGSVFGSLDLDRDKKVESLLRDINSGLRTPTGVPNFDDQVGGPQELRFTRDELARAESGAQVAKSLVFLGDGGRYTLTFEARNPNRGWSGLNDSWRSIGGFFPPGAPISVTSRNAGNLDLFVTGNDGRVYTSGTVTLIETYSSAVGFGAASMNHHWEVHFQAATPVAVTSRQTAKRSAISLRQWGAESRCRRGRKCGEMPLNADRNRCACPGD